MIINSVKPLFHIYLNIITEAWDEESEPKKKINPEDILNDVNSVLYYMFKNFPELMTKLAIRGESDYDKFLRPETIETLQKAVDSALNSEQKTIFGITVSDLSSLMQAIEFQIRKDLLPKSSTALSNEIKRVLDKFPVFSWYHSPAGKQTRTYVSRKIRGPSGTANGYTGKDYDMEFDNGQIVWKRKGATKEMRKVPEKVEGRIIYFQPSDDPELSLKNLPKVVSRGIDIENATIKIPLNFSLTVDGKDNPSITFKDCMINNFDNIDQMTAREAIEFMRCSGINEIDGSKFNTYKFISKTGKYDPKNLPKSTIIVCSFDEADKIISSFLWRDVFPYFPVTKGSNISSEQPRKGTIAYANKRERIEKFYDSFYPNALTNQEIQEFIDSQMSTSIPKELKNAISMLRTSRAFDGDSLDRKLIQSGKGQAGMTRNQWYVTIPNPNSPIKYSILQFDASNRKDIEGFDSENWDKNAPLEPERPVKKSEDTN